MIVYHGGTAIIENPDVKFSKKYLDFGRGFYVTTYKEQAEKWAKRRSMRNREKAVVNKKLFDVSLDNYNEVVKYIKSNSKIENIDTRIEEDMENKYVLILANGDIVITNKGKDKKVGNALNDSLDKYL